MMRPVRTLMIVALLLQSTAAYANPGALAARISSAMNSARPNVGAVAIAPRPAVRPLANRAIRSSNNHNNRLKELLGSNPALALDLATRAYRDDEEFRALMDEHDLQIFFRDREQQPSESLSFNVLDACDGHREAQAFVAKSVLRIAKKLKTSPGFTNEDIAQSFWEKFSALCRDFSVQGEAQTYALINTILKRIAVDTNRKIREVPGFESLDESKVFHANPFFSPIQRSPEAWTEATSFVEELSRVLTPREREALGLRVIGHSNKDVASLMSIQENTVKDLLKSARKKARVLEPKPYMAFSID